MVGIDEEVFADPCTTSAATQRCLELARTAFFDAMLLSYARGFSAEKTGSSGVDLAGDARRESTAIRGSGYVQHLTAVIEGVTASSEAAFHSTAGLSGASAMRCFLAARRLIEQRFNARMERGVEAANGVVASQPRNRKVQKQVQAALGTWLFMDPRGICRLDSTTLAHEGGVATSEAEAFLRPISRMSKAMNVT